MFVNGLDGRWYALTRPVVVGASVGRLAEVNRVHECDVVFSSLQRPTRDGLPVLLTCMKAVHCLNVFHLAIWKQVL